MQIQDDLEMPNTLEYSLNQKASRAAKEMI
jgi:hypothetical protein